MGQPEVVGQAAVERIVRPSSRGVGDWHVPTLLSGTQHAAERRKPGGGELPVPDCSVQGALRCRVIMSADNTDGYGSNEIGNADGHVPYNDIGLSLSEALDPWGLRYRYKPNALVIQPSTSGYGISSASPTANTVAMQIYSQGPNRTDDGGLGDDIAVSVSVAEVRGYMANVLP